MDSMFLTSTRNTDFVALGTGGQRVIRCWDQITSYLERTLGPAHARVFAEPQSNANAGTTDWYAAGAAQAKPLKDLPPEAADQARARLSMLLVDLQATADRLRQSRFEDERVLAEILALALIVPSEDAVWVQPRDPEAPESDPPFRPILVGWGQTLNGEQPAPELLIGIAGAYRRPADKAAMRILGPPPSPSSLWNSRALICALLLALPLFLLLLWQNPSGWFHVPAAQCVVEPGHLDRVSELRDAEAREARLRQEIAGITLDLGNRRAACPPPSLRAELPLSESPTPRPDLPEERWRRGEVSLLEGCWNLDSDYATRNVRTGEVNRVRSWQMCFDRSGRGRQTLVFENGWRCEAPAVGRFEGDAFIVDDMQNVQCNDDSIIYRRQSTCRRLNDQRAQCEAVHVDPNVDGRSSFVLRR